MDRIGYSQGFTYAPEADFWRKEVTRIRDALVPEFAREKAPVIVDLPTMGPVPPVVNPGRAYFEYTPSYADAAAARMPGTL
jgi:hypothetical protein